MNKVCSHHPYATMIALAVMAQLVLFSAIALVLAKIQEKFGLDSTAVEETKLKLFVLYLILTIYVVAMCFVLPENCEEKVSRSMIATAVIYMFLNVACLSCSYIKLKALTNGQRSEEQQPTLQREDSLGSVSDVRWNCNELNGNTYGTNNVVV